MAFMSKRPKLRASLIAIGALVALIVAAGLFVASDRGRALVVGMVLRAIAGNDVSISYAKLGGDWPSALVISGLSVSDRAGLWLEARQLSIDWRLVDLLRGRVTIDALVIDEPVFHRLARTSAAQEAPARFDLPFALEVKSLRLLNGRVEDKVKARFEARGALSLVSPEYAGRLDARRLDGIDERVSLSALFNKELRSIALDLDIRAAEQGIVAGLIGWADAPAFTVRAKGDGPPSDWRLRLDADLGDAGALTLAGKLAWSGSITARIDGEALLGDRFARWRNSLGPHLKLNGAYSRREGEEAGALHIASDVFRADVDVARGAPDHLGQHMLSGAARLQAAAGLASTDGDYRLGAATISASLGGTDTAPQASIDFKLTDLAVTAYDVGTFAGRLLLAWQTLPRGRAVVFDGSGKVLGLGGVTPSADWALEGHYQLRSGDLVLGRLALDGNGLSVWAKGELRRALSRFDARLKVENLSAVSPLLGVALQGNTSLEAQAQRAGEGAPWIVAVAGDITHGVVADMPLSPLAGDRLNLAVRLAVDADGALELRRVELKGAHLDARAHGFVFPALALEAAADTDLEAIGGLADFVAGGPLAVALKAEGELAAPRLSLTAKSASAMIEGLDFGTLALTMDLDRARGPATGRLRLRSDGASGSGDISAVLAQDAAGTWRLEPLEGEVFDALVTGALALDRDGAFTGRIEARLGSIAPLLALALGEDADGQGRGRLTVEFAREPSVQAAIEVTNAGIAGLFWANAFKARYKRAGRIDDIEAFAREGTLAGLGRNAIDFGELALTMTGPSSGRRLSIEAKALGDVHGALQIEGLVARAGTTRQLALERLKGELWAVPLALAAPTRLVMSDEEGLSLEPMRLMIGEGAAAIQLARTRRSLDLGLELESTPLSLIGSLLGLDWGRGTLDGTLVLSTAAARPRGTLALRLKELQLRPGVRGSGTALSGRIDGAWNGHSLTLGGIISGGNASGLDFNARLPLVTDRSGALRFAPEGALKGEAHWAGRLGDVWALMPLDNHRLDGDGTFRLNATGTWRTPRLAGTLALTRGSYDNLVTGTRLTALELKVQATLDEIHLTATASDGAAGVMQGQGRLLLSSARRYPMEATIDFTQFRIVGHDTLTAVASGAAALSGPLRDLSLDGRLRLERVDARIPERLPATLPSLPVTYVGLEPHEEAGPAGPGGAGMAIALNLAVEIPGRAYLRGRGLNAEWSGTLALTGTTAQPRIEGEIGLMRGTLDFAGNIFELSRGRVTFQGGETIDPEIEVAATRQVKAAEVSLAVTGHVSSPTLAIQSVPALPQDEAVALLLFGKPASELSAYELVQVARGAATLTGAGMGGGVGLLGRAREALGLDVLSVGLGEVGATPVSSAGALAEGATVSAGRRLSDRVYVGVTQGMTAASGTIEIDIQVTPRLSVKSVLGEATGSAAGLDWKWDY